jgi:hypothetical protein
VFPAIRLDRKKTPIILSKPIDDKPGAKPLIWDIARR